jgi:hypothetical protein
MTIDQSIIDDLNASGGTAAKWDAIGDVRKVKITAAAKQQVTDFATGEPLSWPNGEPKFQLVFTGTDPDTGDETRIFAKGFMYNAVKDAFRAAGATPEVGGVLAVQWIGEEPSKVKGYNPSKKWKAQYQPPSPITLQADDLM